MDKGAPETSPIMKAAAKAALRVASWSKAKQEYAARVMRAETLIEECR